MVELGSVLPSMQFHISQPNGDFVCMVRGLLFEGNVLAYDRISNEAEWVPVQGMAEDLSQAEEASTRELSTMVPLYSTKEAQRLDQLGEQRSESGGESDAKKCPTEAPCEEGMEQGYEGGPDEEGSDSIPNDSCSPASGQGSTYHTYRYSLVHHPGATAGQASAHLRMKVTPCLEAKKMPPA